MTNDWAVGDLAQLDHEYKVQNNPSLFRIRSITNGQAILGQLDPDDDDYHGLDTSIALDDPDLVRPYPEILAQYPRHVR
jgi:hypothetical protein